MSREFLVWFEPVADGLFATCGVFLAIGFLAIIFTGIGLGCSMDSGDEGSKLFWVRRTIAVLVVMLLICLCMTAINPFTDGPHRYDEAHKTPQQVEKE